MGLNVTLFFDHLDFLHGKKFPVFVAAFRLSKKLLVFDLGKNLDVDASPIIVLTVIYLNIILNIIDFEKYKNIIYNNIICISKTIF